MNRQDLQDTHHLTIGAPLLLILVFCFSFFLLRPVSSDQAQAVSSTANTHKAPSTSSIRPLPVTTTKLSTIDPVQTVDSQSSAASAGNSSNTATGTPQAGAAGGATTTPQHAPQNHGNKAHVSGVSGLLNSFTPALSNIWH